MTVSQHKFILQVVREGARQDRLDGSRQHKLRGRIFISHYYIGTVTRVQTVEKDMTQVLWNQFVHSRVEMFGEGCS